MLGQLPPIVVGIRLGRDDEERAPGDGGGVGGQDFAGLGRVRGSEYEREWHTAMVARGEDAMQSGAQTGAPGPGCYSRIATTRAGAAPAPARRSGKQATVKPVGGSWSRFARRSICE